MINRTHLLQKAKVAQNTDRQQALSAGPHPNIFGHCSAAGAVLQTHRKLAHGSESCLLGLGLDSAQCTWFFSIAHSMSWMFLYGPKVLVAAQWLTALTQPGYVLMHDPLASSPEPSWAGALSSFRLSGIRHTLKAHQQARQAAGTAMILSLGAYIKGKACRNPYVRLFHELSGMLHPPECNMTINHGSPISRILRIFRNWQQHSVLIIMPLKACLYEAHH